MGVDDVLEKNLFMLILFYIFSWEADFSQYEMDSAKLETLKNEYRAIIERLDKLVEQQIMEMRTADKYS